MDTKFLRTLMVFVTGSTALNAANNFPNIIYILADDMGYGDISYLNPKSQVQTPNLDRLGASGMVFTDAHSGSSVSTPTRYGILTGRYAFRSSLKNGVLWGYSSPLIEEGRTTVGNVLQKAGYKTAAIGKWYLGMDWQKIDNSKPLTEGRVSRLTNEENVDFTATQPVSVNKLGFDYTYLLPASLDMPPYVYVENGKVENNQMTTLSGMDKERGVFFRTGKASTDFKIEESLDHFIDKAIQFISNDACQDSNQPFFLYLPLTAPHTPWLPAKKYVGKSGAGKYGDFVVHLDDAVGRLIETLRQMDMLNNTLIIFTSDNGADWKPADMKLYPDHKANGPYRGQKSDIWEGGHRIPFIVSWPSEVESGKVCDLPLCLTDLFATCAELTDYVPAEEEGMDSQSFLSMIKGKQKRTKRHIVHHSIDGMFAIRKGQWKLIEGRGSGGWSSKGDPNDLPGQLYDMKEDPYETNNLFDRKPHIVKKLTTLLEFEKQR